MIYKHIFPNSLASVLVYLLASIQIGIPIPTAIFGNIAVGEPQLEVTRSTPLLRADFARAEDKPNSVIFVGDVLLARNIEFLMNKHGSAYPYEGIQFSRIATKPYVIGNFEASVPQKHVPTEALQLNFSVDPEHLPAAQDAGFTHFSLANNHSFDYGLKDFKNTTEQITQVGLEPFGHPKQISRDSVSFLSLQEIDVALIGVHALERQPSQAEIDTVLKYASKRSDFQIVYVHWGIEYDLESSKGQQKLAKQFVEAGADLIIGHHPHVVQEIALIDGVPVFYSLGNYIFDQYKSTELLEGLMLHIEMNTEPLVHLLPVSSQFSISQPKFLNNKQQNRFLHDLAERSDPALQAYIQYGVIPLDTLVATSSKMAMMSK